MGAEIQDKNGVLFSGTLEAMASKMDRFISRKEDIPPDTEGDLRLLQEIVRLKR